jgi:hypothetical protein
MRLYGPGHWALGFRETAVVEKTEDPLREEANEDENTNDLVGRIYLLGL